MSKNGIAKISASRLREIIIEEIAMHEQVDHAGIRDVVNAASKLLAAVENFKKVAAPTMMSAVTPQIAQIEKVLEDMVSTPGSYVNKPKLEPQKVSLKPAKASKVV